MPCRGIENLHKLLNDLEILWDFNAQPASLVEDLSIIRKMDYKSLFFHYYKNRIYTFILSDMSLIGFEEDMSKFFYMQSPFENIKDYLKKYGLTLEDNITEADFIMDDLQLRAGILLSRYDYDEECYNQGSHPVAHIHLGFKTDIRIGCIKQLKPTSFVLFILRQFYPDYWRTLLFKESMSDIRAVVLKSVKDNLNNIPAEYYNDGDKNEMYMH